MCVGADHDAAPNPKGLKVTDARFAAIDLSRDPFHGEWKYTGPSAAAGRLPARVVLRFDRRSSVSRGKVFRQPRPLNVPTNWA